MPAEDQFTYRVEIATDSADLISSILTTRLECAGTQILDAETESPDGDEPTGAGLERVTAYFQEPTPDAELEIRSRVEDLLEDTGDLRAELVSCEHFTDEDWKESWKDFFEPVELTDDIWVGPPWLEEEVPDPDAGTRLIIEPGMAFGTGSHETTQLTAQLLVDRLERHTESVGVLDVGCGSGVLSMVAARLGAEPVVGLDISQEAVDAARENLEVNELVGRAEFSTRPLAELDGTFELVVANILDHVLLDLRDELFAHVKPGGALLVSGVSTDRADEFIAEFLPPGWSTLRELSAGEWTAFEVVEK